MRARKSCVPGLIASVLPYGRFSNFLLPVRLWGYSEMELFNSNSWICGKVNSRRNLAVRLTLFQSGRNAIFWRGRTFCKSSYAIKQVSHGLPKTPNAAAGRYHTYPKYIHKIIIILARRWILCLFLNRMIKTFF